MYAGRAPLGEQPHDVRRDREPDQEADPRGGEDAEPADPAGQQREADGDEREEHQQRQRPTAGPRTAPTSITPSDCAVIGTEAPNGKNAGTSPSAAMIPTKTATSERSRLLDVGDVRDMASSFARGT